MSNRGQVVFSGTLYRYTKGDKIISSLEYFMPIENISQLGKIIYSCDMLRLNFSANRILFNNFMNNLCYDKPNYQFYESRALFKYRYVWTIDFYNSTMTIGFMLNNGKSQNSNNGGFVEFNPNKCIDNKTNDFFDFWDRLEKTFKKISINRYDIAVDIPIKRAKCTLKRNGNKTYIVVSKDFEKNDYTEYLGLIHNNGTIKVYNKTKENSLDYYLTRYEFTFDSLKSNDINKILMPLYIDDTKQTKIEFELSSTERVLLNYLLNDDNMNYNFNMLSRKMRQKLEPYIEQSKQIFKPDILIIKQVLDNIKNIFTKK